MFRSSSTPSAIETLVNKATDENLTSENWEYILAVCDKVNASPDNGPKEAVSALQKRIGHRSANVQLYSLTLADSLVQNCGTKAHRELASRSFTQALVRMGSDRSVHNRVKSRLVEVMEQMVRTFESDPSLSLMSEALDQVKAMNPTIIAAAEKPRERPVKRQDTTTEDDQLRMALELSLRESKAKEEQEAKSKQQEEEQKKKTTTNGYESVTGGLDPNATISRVRALYDLTLTEPGELSFRKGDVIFVLESVYPNWWRGSLRGEIGIFPVNYVIPIPDTASEDVDQEAEDEAQVFAEANSVDRLLSILSSPSGPAWESDELERVYKASMGVRPLLLKLIDRYAQEKEEMLDLNRRFTAAMQKYEEFVDSRVRQYHAPQGYQLPQQYKPAYGPYDNQYASRY
ncbi:hypothetical protein V1525DRAFT_374804 [Lipomyces kononenkoae]|uniref:Uncharacterized protein n=1 Tax=Lipomyces kononenkoae TaxID=34357 RepID=A0ACC3T3A7_LIPKO